MIAQTTRPAVHSTFRLERSYSVPPARVFQAFADAEARRRWLIEGEGFVVLGFAPDFREGGKDVSRFRFGDGPEMSNECTYHEIVENERLIYAYRMDMAGEPMSVSLTTIEFIAQDGGTLLVLTEHGAYLDGRDDGTGREQGVRELLDILAGEVEG